MLKRLLYGNFLAQLVVTRRCNLSCGYCSEFDQVSDPIPTDVLKKRIDHLKKLGTICLEFTGGEPMMHPDIFELIEYGKQKKFIRVMLISNAYLFDEDKIDRLNQAKLSELQVSIDGVTPNETTIKVLKPLRRRLEMLAKKAKFRVVLNSVIGSAPPNEVLEVIDFAKEQGFVPRVQFIHDDHGQLLLKPEDMGLIDDIKSRLGKRFMEGGDYRKQFIDQGSAPFKCRAGSRYLYIDEFGMIRWCSQTREDFGKPIEQYTYKDLKDQFYTPKSCNTHCTVGCVRNNSRYDKFRSQPIL